MIWGDDPLPPESATIWQPIRLLRVIWNNPILFMGAMIFWPAQWMYERNEKKDRANLARQRDRSGY